MPFLQSRISSVGCLLVSLTTKLQFRFFLISSLTHTFFTISHSNSLVVHLLFMSTHTTVANLMQELWSAYSLVNLPTKKGTNVISHSPNEYIRPWCNICGRWTILPYFLASGGDYQHWSSDLDPFLPYSDLISPAVTYPDQALPHTDDSNPSPYISMYPLHPIKPLQVFSRKEQPQLRSICDPVQTQHAQENSPLPNSSKTDEGTTDIVVITIDDRPIAVRKEIRTCTLHPICKYVSLLPIVFLFKK